ncbi:DNA-cytosine methyltransferase [Intrasporangium calvum DSM 43043]|uniref:DNA-cytosine methyltransferase n=1 Tax=Intrasporangium calvum (strain ATCC 23552 / DSM 43043 / JCM 3097 / NBRC 12989 / NCIMB 10167 / NRRL B-3866 / 7 KIP) TaxID=710696 RepID=E6SC43_INTC7|nr:DNA-cytosine methyltransferase [Intrasporangium calvum DSM 43043]
MVPFRGRANFPEPIDVAMAQGHAKGVTDDRVPGVQESDTALFSCMVCPDVEIYGNDTVPDCPNATWHPMTAVDDPKGR